MGSGAKKEDFKAYIGDFGLARGGPDSFEDHNTVTSIVGTNWYLPDDYKRNLDLKYAVDTFCYGIFLFEFAMRICRAIKFQC